MVGVIRDALEKLDQVEATSSRHPLKRNSQKKTNISNNTFHKTDVPNKKPASVPQAQQVKA